jgi:RNA polymerase sigma-70 factor (ECF subfamily)
MTNAAAPDPNADLMHRAARGEAEAVDAWFRAEHAPVYRVCLGILGDADAAADVAQDAMLHLLDRLDRYDPERPWRAWRDAVVVRLCRDRLRRGAARARAERAGGMDALAARERAQAAPGAGLAAREMRDLVAEALRILSEREREAFVLRDLEELSTADVALAMGVGASTVRSLLTLARRRLREHLAPRLAEPGREQAEGDRR